MSARQKKRIPTRRDGQATPSAQGQTPAHDLDERVPRVEGPSGGMPPFLSPEARPASEPETVRSVSGKGLGGFRRRRQRLEEPPAGDVPPLGEEEPEAKKPVGRKRRGLLVAVSVLLGICAALAIGFVILSNTSAFVITSIECEATEHVGAEDIATLAAVPEGTTLLNYDAALIEANLKRNPWVGDVEFSNEFPDKLRITVTERAVTALVPMSVGSVVWCLGSGDVWIEPIKVVPAEGQTMIDAVLAAARERGALLIADVPSSISPVAGAAASDDIFAAISSYRFGLSAKLMSQVVSFTAPSTEGLGCTLESGVEISLGQPSSIAAKEAIVEQLLAKYPGRITYINVRVPSNPSYRMLDSETVQEGSGVMGRAAEQQGDSALPGAEGEAAEGSQDATGAEEAQATVSAEGAQATSGALTSGAEEAQTELAGNA